jgi:hypothetical protein
MPLLVFARSLRPLLSNVKGRYVGLTGRFWRVEKRALYCRPSKKLWRRFTFSERKRGAKLYRLLITD